MNTAIFPPSPLKRLQEERIRKNVESCIDLKKFFIKIDKIPLSNGARVIYFDAQLNSVILRDFVPFCQSLPPTIILREKPKSLPAKEFGAKLQRDKNDSALIAESVNMALSCGGAILSWVAIVGGGITIPLTGGASTAVAALGYSALAASTLQCSAALARVGFEIGNSEYNDYLDSAAWYNNMSTALDVIALGGAGGSLKQVTNVQRVIKRSTGKNIKDALKGLNRQQRKALTDEVVKLNHPGVPRKVLKELVLKGHVPKRLSQRAISASVMVSLTDALSGSLTVLGSINNGVINTLAIGIYERIENL